MKAFICTRLPRILATLCALGAIAVAFEARSLGIGHDAAWGPSRKALLLVGIGTFIFAQRRLFTRGIRTVIEWAGRSTRLGAKAADVSANCIERGKRSSGIRLIRQWTSRRAEAESSLGDSFVDDRFRGPLMGPRTDKTTVWLAVAILLLGIVVGLVYVWYVSVGFWTRWPHTTAYYDLLADSLIHGQTTLQIEPPSQLARLSNPYDFDARKGITVLWDASYFRGKYYLYWGPAPAAIVALLKIAGIPTIGDEHIVFAGVGLVWLFTILILLNLWRRYSGALPAWLILPGLAMAGLVHPLPWVLNRPAIHEAAIAAGQAFFMAGLYFVLPALQSDRASPGRLALAGVMWSMAVSSRLVLGAAVVFFCAILVWRIVLERHSQRLQRVTVLGLTGLVLPLVIAAGLLGLYDYARFGDPFETGWKYHLSGRGDYSQGLGEAFNIAYLLPNTYNYLMVPVRRLSVFPFIKPVWGRAGLSPLPIELPKWYYAEQVTGVLFSTPFVVFSLFLAWWLACKDASPTRPTAYPGTSLIDGHHQQEFRVLCAILIVGLVLVGLPIALYFTASMRFLLDVAPLLIILATMGSWVAYSINRTRPIRQALVLTLILVLTATSIIASMLLGVTSFESRFEHLNPELFDRITRFLVW